MRFLPGRAAIGTGLPGTDASPSLPRDPPGRPSVVGRSGDAGPAAPGAAPGTTPRAGLGQWFDGSAPGAVVELRGHCLRRIASDVWLLNGRRVWLRVVARVSWERARTGGVALALLDRWLADVLEALAGEQREEERAGVPWRASRDRAYYRALGRALGLDPVRARTLCVHVNRLPVDARRQLLPQESAVVSQGR